MTDKREKKVRKRSTADLKKIKGDLEQFHTFTKEGKKKTDEGYVTATRSWKTNSIGSVFYKHVVEELKTRM